jgi:N-acetylglutamate synthase-like GNAT family acetyltransferase
VSPELAPVHVRRARLAEAQAIAELNNGFADEAVMLHRTPETVALAIVAR